MGKHAIWVGVCFLSLLATAGMASAATAEVSLEAPPEVAAGTSFEVTWRGDTDPADLVTIVAPDTPEGAYRKYRFARGPSTTFFAPDDPGTFELRYLSSEAPHATLARRTIEVTPVTATLTGPATVEAGGTIELDWTGPDNGRDFITVVLAGTEERTYGTYVQTRDGNPARIEVPKAPGEYEARYLTGQEFYTLARHVFKVSPPAEIEDVAPVTEGVAAEDRGEPIDQ